jgi:hypothetical protein
MKITRKQLKKIIRETSVNDMAPRIRGEEEDARLMDMYSDIDDHFDGGYDKESKEWIVYNETSGRFEPSGVSDPTELGKVQAYHNTNGAKSREFQASQMAQGMMENKMKITKRQLKRIIQEEKQKLLSEAIDPRSVVLGSDYNVDEAIDKIEAILNDLWHRGVADNRGLKLILNQLIKDIDSGFIGEPK